MIFQSEVSVENRHIVRKFFLVVLILLIGGVIGIVVATHSSTLSRAPKCPPVDTMKENPKEIYQAGFNAARKLVEDSSIGQVFRSPDDIRAIGGTVTAIDGNKISIHINSSNPFDDPALLDRTIIVSDTTAIVGVTPVVDTKNTTTPITYTKTNVTVSDIKVGSYISVVTADNVKTMKEFAPDEIDILK